jgi:SAM-dependent methyltransferase
MEHVDAPINLLRECRRVLSDKGILVLGLPIEGSIVNWLRGENYFIDHPGHLYSFSLRNTSVLLETTGFSLRKFYFEPRIVRNKIWLSALQHLSKRVAFPLSIGYWAIAERK